MRPTYISCQKESGMLKYCPEMFLYSEHLFLLATLGGGSDQRRKNIMHNYLQGSSLFHNLSRVTLEEYRKKLAVCFETLQVNINEELENIARDIHSIVAEAGHVPEAQQEPELARALELEIDRAEGILANARNVMEAVASEHAVGANS